VRGSCGLLISIVNFDLDQVRAGLSTECLGIEAFGRRPNHAGEYRDGGTLAEEGRAYLVVNKNLGSDSLARWLNQQGWPTTRLCSRRGYRILEVQPQT